MRKKKLKATDVEWAGGVFRDKNAVTFKYEDAYYKAVLPSAAPWFLNGKIKNLLHGLAQKGFIPATEESDLEIEGLGPVFAQKTEYYTVEPCDYCPEMLREAALVFCDMNLMLLKRGFSLLDGHTHNFILQGTSSPKWCDIGSITQSHLKNPFVGISEFLTRVIYPLLLRRKNPYFAELAAVAAIQTCFSHETAAELGISPNIPQTDDRGKILEYLKELLSGLQFTYLKTEWSNYHDPSQSGEWRTSNRYQIFTRMFKALSPKTVIDFGANAGTYSRVMADSGAEVLAVEPDETAMAKHFALLRQTGYDKRLKLKKGAVSFARREKPADLVVALALTHHLYLSQGWNWKSIVRFFAQHTKDAFITEYMPNGLCTRKIPPYLPPDYTLERFVAQLERYFTLVETIEYDYSGKVDSPRIFLLCRGKRDTVVDDGFGPLPVFPD